MSLEVTEFFSALVDSITSLAFMAQGKCDDCPGSENTLVAAAWANIAYTTHAALLYYVNFTGFGLWAPFLYAIGAIGALIAVAINSPPRNYTWFVLGPAIYGFLVGSTQEVQGVSWVVAGNPQNMEEVWRDAETGIRNSPLLKIDKYAGIRVDKINGPSGKYPVAMPLLFLDELFSDTSNQLVQWTGLYSQLGEGGNNSNLAQAQNLAGDTSAGAGQVGEGPWYLMSNLKAPMVENITNAHIRNPQLRDAFVTFLASECGDSFKQAVDSGAYNGASMARGSIIPKTIMIDGAGADNDFSKSNGQLSVESYEKSLAALNVTSMPAPRSLQKLLQEPEATGSFSKFSPDFSGKPSVASKAASSDVLCADYLYDLIQGMRHEMGHAYHQLIRSAPRGFTKPEQVLFTLFYGWDIRKSGSSEYANPEEIKSFTQNLIFTYMLKNEMQFAPQITATEQKFAPSDSTIGYSNAYVGSMGAKTKSSELYNWAVMMPYIQGILLYVIIVGYPFAAMAMLIPGHWKGFYTWVTFFAWIKLWDVGFAVVQVLERSVWAMMGNHSNMARVANMLIQVGSEADTVTVECQTGSASGSAAGDLLDRCAVPDVKSSVGNQQENKAMFMFDKALLLGASVDLDVSNGYYLYIMAALYFAVPAVTGQLVLGAKAGLGGLLTNSLSDGAKDISGAAKSGLVGDKSNQINTAKEAISQAAMAKSYRSPTNAFLSSLQSSNAGLDLQKENARLGEMSKAFGNAASMAGLTKGSFDSSAGALAKSGQFVLGNGAKGADSIGAKFGLGTGSTGSGSNRDPGFFEKWGGKFGEGWSTAQAAGSNYLGQNQMALQADAMQRQANIGWDSSANSVQQAGLSAYSQNQGQLANFQAESDAWDARNRFAIDSAGMAGVYGINPGSLHPGQKPTQPMGMAMSGMLGQPAYAAAHYSGTGLLRGADDNRIAGKTGFGSMYLGSFWTPTSTQASATTAVPARAGSAAIAEWAEGFAGKRAVDVRIPTGVPLEPKK